MSRFLRPVLNGIFIVAAASLLASCKDEGGVLDVFFWAEGRGDCERITVTIDLQSADALLAPPANGRDQCDIYKVLENAGCDFEVETLTAPDRLRVTIDDCRIDDRSGLFRCAFSDGTLEDLEQHTTAVCDCFGPSCDETPRLCVSDNSEDEACETSVPSTSSTTSSSTTTSTSFGNSTQPTMSTTTSTTFPDLPAERFTVEFEIEDGAGIGALEFDIDYASIAGAGARSARAALTDPQCSKLVETADVTFEYDDVTRTIHVEMSNLPGTSGPLLLVDCSFLASSEPSSTDFELNVVVARNLDGDLLDALPVIRIGDIYLFLTTTTLDEGESTTTTTLLEPQDYEITFRVDSASDAIGAIQWATSYASVPGSFEGSGSGVECDLLVLALFGKNDKDRVCSDEPELERTCNSQSDCAGHGSCSVVVDELVLGIVSVQGFEAPVDLARCRFQGTSSDPPEAEEFAVVMEDLTDAEGQPITATLSISITPVP